MVSLPSSVEVGCRETAGGVIVHLEWGEAKPLLRKRREGFFRPSVDLGMEGRRVIRERTSFTNGQGREKDVLKCRRHFLRG